MPVINLGPFGRLEINWQAKPAESLLPMYESSSIIHVDDKPPSYTELPTEYRAAAHMDRKTADETDWVSSVRAKKPACRVRQLRRYLIEIVALTLGADFDKLNAAMYNEKDATGPNSILSAIERDELFALSCLVKRVHDTYAAKLPINAQDRQHILDAITNPAEDIDSWGLRLCAMDLIAWYAEPHAHPIPWTETVIDHFRVHHISYEGFPDTVPMSSMKSLGAFIPFIAMKEDVGAVLVQAFEMCCLREGFGVVVTGDPYTPTRFDYSDLYFKLFYVQVLPFKHKVCKKWYASDWGDCVCGIECPSGDGAAVEQEEAVTQ